MKRLPRLFVLFFLILSVESHSQSLITQRQIALLEKARRPNDPWPRGDGHILLGEPGAPVTQKAYHEPGGSFTPSPGSFGLAIWITDAAGKLVTTSDDIPVTDINQQFVFSTGKRIPGLFTSTPYYRCTWSYDQAGRWRLGFTPTSNHRVWLVVRSIGPAGGPVESITWDSLRNGLLVNHSWIVLPDHAPERLILGDETKDTLLHAAGKHEPVYTPNGWAFAKMEMPRDPFTLLIKDTRPQFASMLHYGQTTPQFSCSLPDKRFSDCLNAQVTNLLIGYTGKQTGPGEPINYPLAWERDGAYSLQAMAKSGQLETARDLSIHFAENDFFGGFGAEGDAPGSAINALTEVAMLLNDKEYDQWLWPHIERKLTLIDEMMGATGNVYKNYIGPIVPAIAHETKRRKLISRKTDNGLIDGTMDLHFPALYINAISYRGMVQAARLAERVGKKDAAALCLQKAEKIRAAWMNNFGKEKYDNERNFMISIYPSWIIDKTHKLFTEKITAERNLAWDEKGQPRRRPEWTYFTLAEAHQWLFMDKPEKTWETLHYFWNNQCSPGLYSFWEGYGEENTFRQWDHYRGWLQPKYVTPHYWTASEMTLLQLDMLAYVDESGPDFEIVVGAGVPTEWLDSPMSVKDMKTKAGIISWEYRDRVLSVTVRDARRKYNVRPGVVFANNKVKVNVKYK